MSLNMFQGGILSRSSQNTNSSFCQFKIDFKSGIFRTNVCFYFIVESLHNEEMKNKSSIFTLLELKSSPIVNSFDTNRKHKYSQMRLTNLA